MSAITLGLFLLLAVLPFIGKNTKVRLPWYFLLAIAIYCFYLFLGIFNQHPESHIDIKFQLFSFIFFFALLNQRPEVNYLRVFLILNMLVFSVYVLLALGLFPQLWHEKTVGQQGRILGPSLIPIVLILFIYLVKSKSFDKNLLVALVLGMTYIMLSSNFTNLAIVISLSILIIINWKKALKPGYILIVSVLFVLAVVFVKSPYVPQMVSEKTEYIFKPWEYPTVQTRIQDLNQALRKENFDFFEKFFGQGFGVKSSIYRENKYSPSLSRTLTFHEIDNGFYYLYHRGGWSLLFLFIITHLFLATKLKTIKAKTGFLVLILITNIFSIHYFTYQFYLLTPFFVLYPRVLNRMIKDNKTA